MKRVLISVSDKKNVVAFAKALVEMNYDIISTGGTAKALKEAGISVTPVADITGFPEILDGRVKTLHPNIHAGLLAKDTPEHKAMLAEQHIDMIDLVVVNLYPFQETIRKPGCTLSDAIENIDIGGPTMIRAAAKNFARVGVIVNPDRYDMVIQELKNNSQLSESMREKLALEAFTHTAMYDAAISQYLNTAFNDDVFPDHYISTGDLVSTLRYGENPHQKAAFYKSDDFEGSVAGAKQLQGKELSYNNLVDIDAAWQLVNEFSDENACAIIKHTNPCGCALGNSVADAYKRAYAADDRSAYGGITALNQKVDADTANEIIKTFMEAVIAPDFTEDALSIFKAKPNLRILKTGSCRKDRQNWVEHISGGFLVQERDSSLIAEDGLKVVSIKKPADALHRDLVFAWKVSKHVKSNAIVVAKDGQTLGVGAGQMNRVGSCHIAFEQAGEKVQGAVLASDAFFPFRDSIDLAAQVGIAAIIQPGGSIRDEEVIDAVNEHDITMLFTEMRHFKH